MNITKSKEGKNMANIIPRGNGYFIMVSGGYGSSGKTDPAYHFLETGPRYDRAPKTKGSQYLCGGF